MIIGTPLSSSAIRIMLLGAGELGKEVIIAFQRLGVEVIAVDRYANAPGQQVAHRAHVIDMTDPAALRALIAAERPHIVVPEIEAIATDALVEIEREGIATIIPTAPLIARHKGNDKIPGRQVLAEFDLIAANSGGSIVLGLLLEDFSLGDILAFFQNQAQRNAIFSKNNPWKYVVLRVLAHFAPRYSADRKLIALRAAMSRYGNLPLSKATSGLHGHGGEEIRVLITSFDYDRNRAVFFRSSSSGTIDLGQGDRSDLTLAEAIHASSNAPVMYFDGPAVWPSNTHRYWDGGIAGYNNPVMAGVVEAGMHPARSLR